MLADSRIRTVHHHEQTLPLGAHYTEVAKAINLAVTNHDQDRHATSDVTVTADDTHLIIGYQSLSRSAPEIVECAPAEGVSR
jgi:hypothetical protein